jgi:DNA replication protein DnaC
MKTKEPLTVIEAGERIGEMILRTQLSTLHLTAFLEHYEPLAQDAAQGHWSCQKYLATLTQKEIDRRTGNRYKQRIKDARFPLLKELADFDFTAIPKLNQPLVQELARGRYLADASSVILVGAPGLGKTHIATALGLAACRQGRRVRFYTVAGLVNDLHLAQNEQRLPKFLAHALRHHLIILDELGYVPFSTTGAQLLFQFCSALHERVSLLITTNLPFGDWVQVFGDARLTAGLLDRVTFKSPILEFVGDSYRFRQRLAVSDQA